MESIKKSFDIIVIGSGTGGTTAARFAAEKGLEVCLLDSKEKNEVGDKICGDAVGTEIFEFLKINNPLLVIKIIYKYLKQLAVFQTCFI